MPVVIVPGATNTNSAIVAWNNVATPANVTSSPVAAGFPAVNACDPATWNGWRPNALPAWWQVDYGSPVAIDTVGISSHQFATSATTIQIQHSPDGATWTVVNTYSAVTDQDLIFMFPSVTRRYWRIVQSGGISPVGYISFSARLNFPHAPVDGYVALHHARQYTKLFNDSLKGHFLGNRVMSAGAETEVDMGFVSRGFSDGALRGFESHYNQGRTFFYASCPASIPLDMGYCRALGDDEIMNVEYIEADKLSNVSFGIRAFVES